LRKDSTLFSQAASFSGASVVGQYPAGQSGET
jgi:hypothetical protein